MFCPFCGLEIPDHASMCTYCSSYINLPPELSEGDIKRIRSRYREKYSIETPDASAALRREMSSGIIPALYSARVVAFIFDWGIIVACTAYAMNQLVRISEFLLLIAPLAAFLYFILLTSLSGRTIGKLIVGIQVVGGKKKELPSLFQSIVRSIMMIISFLFLFAGVIAPIYDPDCRAWHDRIAGTYVIYKR